MMSAFNKDDYLDDLPDAGDAAPHAQSSAPGDRSPSGHGAESASSAPQSADADAQATGAGNAGSQTPDAQGAEHAAEHAADCAAGSAANADSAHSGSESDQAQADASQPADETKQSSQDEGEDTLTPLGQAKQEAAEYLDALQRERAEFVNFRNRSKKEQERFREHGIIDVLTALLPALDDVDRIREHSDLDESFNAVATKIDKAFAKFGVEKFGKQGEEFDPTKHEAVLHKPVEDATKETVDTVVEAGYRIGDRVIRAARVVVASPKN